MPSLQSLPKELLLNIISFLTDEPIAIGRLERSGRRLYQFIALNPDLWRDVCLKYFFCFYWEGTCKSLECNSCSKISFKNPFHQPKGTTFRQQFQTVYNGKYTGIVHVLNSLSNREMSAFMALATFDKKTKKYLLSYSEHAIAHYRHGQMYLLQNHPELVHEELASNSSKLRRIPPDLMLEDPREIHTKSLFSKELLKDGRPGFVEGDVVEIQWRNSRISPYGWWKGIVKASYLNPALLVGFPNGKRMADNIQFSPEHEEGILIEFTHFPVNSRWRYMVCSLLGYEQESQLGFIGGIRLVECQHHVEGWNALLPTSTENALAAHIEANLPQDDDE